MHAQAYAPTKTAAEVWAQHKHLASYDDIVKAAGDTFQVLPQQLSNEHSNPCWKNGTTGQLRCLPYFQILGVSKCGTTDMYGRMIHHPQILNCGYKVRRWGA